MAATFMRHITTSIYFAFFVLLSCKSKTENSHLDKTLTVDSLFKRQQNCILNGEPKIFDSSKYGGAWNAAYAYDYLYPKNFKDTSIEILDNEGTIISDTSVAISPDRHAVIKFWIGETISMPQDSIKVSDILRVDKKVDSLIEQLKQSKYTYLTGFTIDTLCHSIDGYYHNVALIGHSDKQGIIYKVEFSVLPVSGNLIAKNLVFTYDKKFTNIYYPIGITVANSFGFAKFDRK
ncbi:MAG: hypothetical protein QM725_08580 [Lacibacter sp.]